jgi:hypothetical protein
MTSLGFIISVSVFVVLVTMIAIGSQLGSQAMGV